MLNVFFGTKNERVLKRLWPTVERINRLEGDFEALDDASLQGKTATFREQLAEGASLDDILPEAFAVVREASKRVLGMRHFDVQLLGGIVLHQGKIAEMKTGEGKTLCATLPVYLNALSGKGVHVVTVNDYLAKRDAEWMDTVYSYLGLTTGVIVAGISRTERVEAYRADITYGQNNEFGFDYLRDNMKFELSERAQRSHSYAIVDEVDSILVDEARTPLIISGPSEDATDAYRMADSLVRKLKEEEHYTIDLKGRQVMLADEGVQLLEELLEIDNFYDPRHISLVHHINQALKAHVIFRRDIDYVVRSGEIIIVDEFTGRLMSGRRWSDGLHQAVEAKEGVTVQPENETLATVTFQNYFRMYDKLAGMTGTADTEAVEFKKIYGLDVVVVPTNKPMIRKDYADVVFSNELGKLRAVVEEIEEGRESGQPVLVGTASIAQSEKVSALLSKKKIDHHVLNAKQHEREAEIVAQAGRLKAVTISTNMAGRGTDIVLGGNPEFLAADEVGTRDPDDPAFVEALARFTESCKEERQKVLDAGGLHILGTERHESRRIDNQLRGRSGRQGDPGSSRFYVSLEDDLMKRFGGERIQALMSRVGLQEDDAIEGALIGRAIENAQKKVEGYHFDVRKHLLDYDNVLNKQREVIYSQREETLRSVGVEENVLEMVSDVIEDIILTRANEKEPVESWDVEGMVSEFNRQFGMEESPADFVERRSELGTTVAQELFEYLRTAALKRYEDRKARVGEDRMEKLSRIVSLHAVDHFWKEHLSNMDHLKEGIGLRGYSQQNPLHVYQRESYELFSAMMLAVKGSVLQNVFVPELPSEEDIRALEEQERELNRQREEAANAVHEDVLAATEGRQGESARGAGPDAVGNRRMRRRQERRTAPAYQAEEADYRPTAVQNSSGTSAKRAADRKKKKAQRKARRKAR